MRKLAAVVVFVAMTSPVFAADNFIKSESDRSGVTGTLNMIGNSIQGFFSHIGGAMSMAGSRSETKSSS